MKFSQNYSIVTAKAPPFITEGNLRIDITGKKFRPVPPQQEEIQRVSLSATTSKFRTDKGNWRHDDQLQTLSTAQFDTFDSPEEDRIDRGSRIMPDPTDPN